MKQALMAISFLLAAVMGTSAIAQGERAFERRYDVLNERINFGMRDGTLTRQQVARLDREMNRISDLMRSARGDGRVNRGERVDIRDAIDRVERDLDQMRVRR